MKYKAYIFDFDLTLADSTKGIITCFKHTLKEFGFEERSDKEICDTIGLTIEQAFEVLTGILNNPKALDMRKVFVKKADKVMVADTHFYDDSIALLQVLQSAGVKVGIVSTKYRYRIEDTFEKQAGSMPVDVIVGGEDVSAHKPDPTGLLKAIEMLSEDKGDVLYIGDSYIDAQTAQNAQVDFAGVTTGFTLACEFEKYRNIYIGKSLMDIFTSINNNR